MWSFLLPIPPPSMISIEGQVLWGVLYSVRAIAEVLLRVPTIAEEAASSTVLFLVWVFVFVSCTRWTFSIQCSSNKKMILRSYVSLGQLTLACWLPWKLHPRDAFSGDQLVRLCFDILLEFSITFVVHLFIIWPLWAPVMSNRTCTNEITGN